MPQPELTGILDRFKVYEDLLARQNAADQAKPLFDGPIEANRASLHEALGDPAVGTVLDETLDGLRRDEAALAFLTETAVGAAIDKTELAEHRRMLEARQSSLIVRLARYYEARIKPKDSDYEAADKLLSLPVAEVAERLLDMPLRYGDRLVTITATRPQDADSNAAFHSRPIFGADRHDIYVGAFRGKYMLFIRAGAATEYSCASIIGITNEQGETVERPTKVAAELGFTREMVGRAKITDGTLVLELINRKG